MEEEIIGNRWKELDYDGYCRECKERSENTKDQTNLDLNFQ